MGRWGEEGGEGEEEGKGGGKEVSYLFVRSLLREREGERVKGRGRVEGREREKGIRKRERKE